ncbi:glycerol-3-phosphate dehydrogenase [Ammoniphilus oxalaticus]|uniref:Glycerol-3-phosphate dehydrogenase [NAD(P)+] n=1 Tax=Ammoniphilus oxalaticus TaxID=66863 RepID=A0A419SP19_9BACL|nr:NAD(P)H-dependent glycerol-3-phosphate dehydrogenase [Ammoniphilus oxalaticus]RKD26038.1 glycerol-3-phosphate dehydrogenase [Ammoniphilus oxalaticus]
MQIGLIGAGSWGTALATVLANNGHEVTIWTRRQQQAEEITSQHTNRRYLPGIELPSTITATTNLQQAIEGKAMILFVIPSHSIRETARQATPFLSERMLLVHAVKGIELETHKRMSEIIKEEIPSALHNRLVVLSGPSHAEEVSRQSPTTVVVAADQIETAEEAQDIFMSPYFRVYTNPDVVGLELGGALKNIIALGAGLSDGLGFGDNAKAALMTRGLAEISRLGVRLGADPLTFSGLAGVGDLIVTCTSQHSRNWRAGNLLGKGNSLQQVLDEMGMVVEGVKTTQAAYELATSLGVEMPITRELYNVLFADKCPRNAVEDLMGRLKKHEMEDLAQN